MSIQMTLNQITIIEYNITGGNQIIRKHLTSIVAGVGMFAASNAFAAGELNIFNWGNYTSPELIEKFEQTYDVKVTITDYDSNDTALAKVRAGAHGFDMAVPSASFMPIW